MTRGVGHQNRFGQKDWEMAQNKPKSEKKYGRITSRRSKKAQRSNEPKSRGKKGAIKTPASVSEENTRPLLTSNLTVLARGPTPGLKRASGNRARGVPSPRMVQRNGGGVNRMTDGPEPSGERRGMAHDRLGD